MQVTSLLPLADYSTQFHLNTCFLYCSYLFSQFRLLHFFVYFRTIEVVFSAFYFPIISPLTIHRPHLVLLVPIYYHLAISGHIINKSEGQLTIEEFISHGLNKDQGSI